MSDADTRCIAVMIVSVSVRCGVVHSANILLSACCMLSAPGSASLVPVSSAGLFDVIALAGFWAH